MFTTWKIRNNTLLLLWLVFFVAYIDRTNFTVAAPYIQKELQLSPAELGIAMSAFLIGYGWLQVIGGIMADRWGGRKTMVFAILWWSVFTALTGVAWGFMSLVVIRFVFGVGESFQPPASWKAVSVWFPKKERLRANALMLGAIALAPAVTPLIVVWCMQAFGWKGVFYFFAIPGIIMAWFVWKNLYDDPAEHPKITKEELSEIYDGLPPASQASKMSLWDACKVPGLLLLSMIYLIFDITFWGFLSWLPSYLVTVRKFAMLKMGIYASLPFLSGFIGLMLADTISNKIFHRNKIVFLSTILAIGSASMFFAYAADNAEVCIAFLSLTAFSAIFMFFGPFWGLVTETLPSQAMGFLSSIINGAGKIGGSVAPAAIGALIQWTGGSYAAGFSLMEGCLLVCAILVFFMREKKPLLRAVKGASMI
ncbi:MAG TPA: MFS transporter [Nitrospirota bacterium]|nr:MFS transporter [Nitrospirota bacterium]